MEKAGEILDHLFQRFNLKRPLREQGVFAVWDACVGETMAGHAQPASIEQGRLLVTVSDPAWMHQLQFLKEEIKQKLNSGLGRGVVREIRFRVGEIKRPEKPAPASSGSRPILLEAGVLKAIDEAVAVIEDEEVRESVRRYLLAVAKPAKTSEGSKGRDNLP